MVIPGPNILRRLTLIAGTLVLIVATALLIEGVRGKSALRAIKRDMEKRGQAADFRKLLPPTPEHFAQFTNDFIALSRNLSNSMLFGRGSCVEIAPGKALRGSQALRPIITDSVVLSNGVGVLKNESTNTWAELEA